MSHGPGWRFGRVSHFQPTSTPPAFSCHVPRKGPSLPLKSHILLYQGEGALPRLFLLCLPLFFLSIVRSVCLSRPQRCLASMPTTSWKLLRLNAWETHQIPAETSDLPKGHSISRASSTTSVLCISSALPVSTLQPERVCCPRPWRYFITAHRLAPALEILPLSRPKHHQSTLYRTAKDAPLKHYADHPKPEFHTHQHHTTPCPQEPLPPAPATVYTQHHLHHTLQLERFKNAHFTIALSSTLSSITPA